MKELKCIHRHTIKSHPTCFAKGLVKWTDEKSYVKYSQKPWYTFPGYRIGYIDIETDNLSANFGTMLSWCIKEKDGETEGSIITKNEIFNGDLDRRLVSELVDKMRDYTILISYYGTNFDIPFIRSKALFYGLNFPEYGEIYHHDLYFTVRSKLALSRNSLAVATSYLGIPGKTPIDGGIWYKAKYGDKESLDLVYEHNIADVVILEELHKKLEPFSKWTKRSV